jgi:spermidine/putrescine-binding protein
MSFFSSITAGASTKAAAGLATAALVVGGGSVAATAASGSSNPTVWGQYISGTVVKDCKDNLADGAHGIGQCVSAIAKTHGAAERAARAKNGKADSAVASSARENHPGGKPPAKGGAGSGGSRPTDHPGPPAGR